MTDDEFYQLMFLFDQKHFALHQLEAIDRWIVHYEDDISGWVTPTELIETLREFYNDR